MSMEATNVTKSFKDWLAEGEALYATTIREYQDIESQLEEPERWDGLS